MASPKSDLASRQVPLPQFIIALILVKSKPASISIKEYLAQLRHLIKQGSRLERSSISHRHLDTAAYQKDVQHRTQQTILALHARIAELEGRNNDNADVNNVHTNNENQTAIASQGKRKRKAIDPGDRPSRLAKQARVANSSSPMQSRHNDIQKTSHGSGSVAPRSVTNSTPKSYVNAFLHHVYILQQTTSDPTSDLKSVAGCLEENFDTIRQIASSAEMRGSSRPASKPDQMVPNNDQSEVETASTIQKVNRLLPVLLQAMDPLDRMNNDQRLEGSIVYKFVKMFEDTLRQICGLAAYDIQASNIIPNPRILNRTKERQPKEAESHDSPTASFEQPRVILDLCDLAIAMTTTLKATKHMQARMLEGCLSILLMRVGSGLKACLFEATDHDTVDYQTREPQHDQEGASRAFEAEGPYLIYILERVSKPMDHETLQASGSALLRSAKKKLQHALLNSVFGENALGLLQPSLELPNSSTDFRHPIRVEPVEIREWYKSEVWKLVGWDVLDDYLKIPIQRLRIPANT